MRRAVSFHTLKSGVFFSFAASSAALIAMIDIAHAAAPITDQAPITLNEAIQSALKINPELRRLKSVSEQKSAEKAQAVSMLFPTVSATASAQRKKDPAGLPFTVFGGQAYNYYAVGLNALQPIYDGGAAWAGLKFKNLEQSQTDLSLQIAERDLELRVFQLFYSVLLQKRRLETLKHSEEIQEAILKVVQERERIGRSNKLDRLQVQTELALLKPKISDAESQFRSQGAELGLLITEGHQDVLQISGSMDIVPTDALQKSFLKEVPQTLPEIEVTRVAQNLNDAQKAVSLAKHFPQLNVTGQFGRNSYTKTDLLGDYQTTYNFAINLTIPLFSGLSFIHERRSLAAREAQLQIEESKVTDQMALEQVQARREMLLSQDRLISSKRAYELARESGQEGLRQYRSQRIDYLQWAQIQKADLDATMAYDSAKFDLVKSAARWAKAMATSPADLLTWITEKK